MSGFPGDFSEPSGSKSDQREDDGLLIAEGILNDVAKQLRESVTTMLMNRQLAREQFYLLRALGFLTVKENPEYQNYCRALRDGHFAISLREQCEIAARLFGFLSGGNEDSAKVAPHDNRMEQPGGSDAA